MKDCVFCNIISKNLKSNIIHENKGAIVIMSDNPEVEGHMLVFAKKHFPTLELADQSSWYYIGEILNELGKRLRSQGYDGYNLLSANGVAAGQSVKHFHFHVIPRKKNDGINAWPNFETKPNNTSDFFEKVKF
ncbi:HIT family protein [Lactobacillus iners]|uniref:HIT family protein n=1 Tax=Lactobacillus iners TaxID=147802 RepID=UPI0001E5DCE5|nr:HIT family protein [Lactobacillus iners]EFO67122.1 histidine triad domain protein [Lactobacillus iners LactinV 09V1-c]MCT7691249.1 HIT family protein [Lactobacillus crispatus]EFQ50223.1 histidine triad domain protein [Lactobacillus iners LEAF 2062A-h1]MCT7670366.1 HIT family protein [Lactobacillus iners]MCT7716727.1 HIT family protein [Lactobacillus iners]